MGEDERLLESPLIDNKGISASSRMNIRPNLIHNAPTSPGEFIESGPISKDNAPTQQSPPVHASVPEPSSRQLKGWSGKYRFPVASPFSFSDTWSESRLDSKTGKMTRPHRGVDIFAVEGTEIYAITDGMVTLLANWPSGLTLRLQGNDGNGYEYYHLKDFSPAVKAAFDPLPPCFPDQSKLSCRKSGRFPVQAGKLIAYVGKTGILKSPPHLHFQAFPNHHFNLEERWNPYQFLVKLAGGVKDGNVPKVDAVLIE